MSAQGTGPRQVLLQDQDVKRWHTNRARSSKATANNYLRLLGVFLEHSGVTPQEFLALPPKERDDLLDDFLTAKLEAEEIVASTAAVYKKAAQSWLRHNGESIQRDINLAGTHVNPKAAQFQIPSQDTLRRILNAADGRERVACSFLSFAGLRPMTLGDYEGTDGLRLKHMPDLAYTDGELVANEVPARIYVPANLSKTRRPYMTLIGAQGLDYLATELRRRHVGGEEITEESLILAPERGRKPALRSQDISDMIRPVLRRVGIQEPPYILRSYFETRCLHAEDQGLTRDMRDFLMGHAGPIGHRYSFHKRLPADTQQRIIEGYQSATRFLETRTPEQQRIDPSVEVVRFWLQMSGLTQEEIEGMDLAGMSDQELVELARTHANPPATDADQKQRIVRLDELSDALRKGWRFKHELSDGRVLIEAA